MEKTIYFTISEASFASFPAYNITTRSMLTGPYGVKANVPSILNVRANDLGKTMMQLATTYSPSGYAVLFEVE